MMTSSHWTMRLGADVVIEEDSDGVLTIVKHRTEDYVGEEVEMNDVRFINGKTILIIRK